MSAARKLNTVTLEEYFALEEGREVRHEYVGGVVRAMAGGTNSHAKISRQITVDLSNSLRGKRCEVYGSDARILITSTDKPRVYYPDISIICDSNPLKGQYQERPVVIIEVLSPSTRKYDLREKLLAYLTIPTLRAYLVVEQDFPQVTCHRRTDNGFRIEQYIMLTDVIPLPEIEAELPLASIYEGIGFDEAEATEG